MKVCFVNVAFGHWYQFGQDRLRKQCEANGIEFVGFGASQPGLEAEKMHQSVGEYSFKPRAVLMAKEQTGADILVWADSSVSIAVPHRLSDFIDRVASAGVWAQYGGHTLGMWCSNQALSVFGLQRHDAMQIPMPIAGLVGFNTSDSSSMNLLDEWRTHAETLRTFAGSHSDHRHDQSVLSYLMHKHNRPLEDAESRIVAYGKNSGAIFDLYPAEQACASS